jgi:hypothetical protein
MRRRRPAEEFVVAAYWLVDGPRDGDGRVGHDRGPTDEQIVLHSQSWLYGSGYYIPEQPLRYVEVKQGSALVLRYVGESRPGQDAVATDRRLTYGPWTR